MTQEILATIAEEYLLHRYFWLISIPAETLEVQPVALPFVCRNQLGHEPWRPTT